MKHQATGTVYKSTGSWYRVKTDNGEVLEARVKGKFRLAGKKLTNPVAVGDRVQLQWNTSDEATITEILPRNNYVLRQSPRKKHFLHLLAANIDQAMLIVTVVEPSLKPGFIDRFLLMTETHDIPVVIVFNKSDLWGAEEIEKFEEFRSIYQGIGYKVMQSSAVSGDGLPAIKEELKSCTTLVGGHSGVGKSSLINALHPELELRTDKISDYSGKGQHTTTFAEMFDLPGGGRLIDTPGIKTLGFNHFEVMDVAHNFREFFKLSSQCKFNNCMHLNEPKCAVREAVEEGNIAPTRYRSYLQIVEEIENQNYWEINKDW